MKNINQIKHGIDSWKNITFCPLAWYSVTWQKNGNIWICCMNTLTGNGEEFWNIKTSSISKLWNSSKIKEIRVAMMQWKHHNYCDGCYKKEANNIRSLRQKSLVHQGEFIENMLQNTQETGEYSWDIKKMDIRFSNLCNLACRMCSSSSSTLRIPLEKKLWKKFIDTYSQEPFDSENFWWDTELFSKLDQIDIAGWEPLINKNFYTLLKMCIEKDFHKSLKIRIMTNATILPWIYKWDNFLFWDYKDIFEMLEDFYSYDISLSVDGYGSSYERIRIWSNWEVVKKNMDSIYKNYTKSIKSTMAIMPTIQIDNIYDFPKLYLYARIRKIHIDVKPLFRPEHFCITNIPEIEKHKIKKYYLILIDQYQKAIPLIKKDFEYIISYMFQSSESKKEQEEYLRSSKIMDDFQKEINITI